ncbi:hypothetical protein [Halomonas sp. BC04]|uniref:hypothetical protein n=1 Tax=Halomonas sp. BC04 TaxID=1403540 RepID=UPI0003ED878F|nr:hypothetical protein [Halomonas sp. BC04]EWH00593.1 hypothetical protein Q427_18655 [Halomonas sp. BC04]
MTNTMQKVQPPERSRTLTKARPKAHPKHNSIEAALTEALASHCMTLAPRASGWCANKSKFAAHHAPLAIGTQLLMPTLCEGCEDYPDLAYVCLCRLGGGHGE